MSEIFTRDLFKRETMNREKGLCPICSKPIVVEDFTSSLSLKEYNISGMCQECQDDFFKDRE